MARRGMMLAAVALTAAACLSGCGDDTFDVSGSLTLMGQGTATAYCSPSGGYDDIHSGADVTIYNADGHAIGLGTLMEGKPTGSMDCKFDFTVSKVPAQDVDIYSVEVSHRGQIKFHRDDAADLELTLG